MKNSRNLIIGAVALVLVVCLALGGALVTGRFHAEPQSAQSAVAESLGGKDQAGVSSAQSSSEKLVTAGENDAGDSSNSAVEERAGNTVAQVPATTPVGEGTSAGVVSSGASSETTPTDEPASDSGSSSPVAPVGDRAVWGPVTPVGPGVVGPTLSGGPTISSPTWSCGSKIILSVTATDPNGVARVWGSYYVAGSKFSFTSSNASGTTWSTTIIAGSDPVTSLVVWAQDTRGENSSLAIGTLCA